MRLTRVAAACAVLLTLSLQLAACGGDDTSESSASGGGATVQHKFGSTQVPSDPKRVVAVGFNDQDFVLSLGVTPVGAREFIGGTDISARPWAQDELDGAKPKIVGSEEIAFEKVAQLRPDLIVGIYSGMKKADYDKLSQIAPTIAQSKAFADYTEPWPDQLETTGEALGRQQEAAKVSEQTTARFEQAKTDNPEFVGKSFAFGSSSGGDMYVYSSGDLRAAFFEQLGFKVPAEVNKLAGKAFFAQISRERLELLNTDVLVMYGKEADLKSDPAFAALDVVKDDRVIYVQDGTDLANAIGFSSPLSLPYAIDQIEPMLADAVGRLG